MPIALLAAALMAAALLVSTLVPAAHAAPGKQVGKGTDSGLPIAYARGFVKEPKTLLVRIKGIPAQSIEVRWQVTCRPGRKKVTVPSGEFFVTPTATRKLKKGTKRPDDCTIDVQAAYQDASVSGQIVIELFARKGKKGKGKKKR